MSNKTFTIFSTRETYDYSEYLEYCELNNIEPAGEDSNDFYYWCGEETQNNIECEFMNLEYAKAKDYPFYVEGTLGLWDGKHDGHIPQILWGIKNALWEVITSVRSGYNDYEAILDEESGVINVNCWHHDGCNCFTIHRLSERGESKLQRDIENGNINDYGYEPKAYCYKKLKKEELW